MDRQQDGNITEAELCQFWNALSGQQVASVGEISEQRLQGMVGKTEADLKALLLVDGPAIFAALDGDEEAKINSDERMVSAALKIQVTPGVRDRC